MITRDMRRTYGFYTGKDLPNVYKHRFSLLAFGNLTDQEFN